MELKPYLWKNNLTMTEFAKKVGCTMWYISEISRYKRKPSDELARKIEKATGGKVKAKELIMKCEIYRLQKNF